MDTIQHQEVDNGLEIAYHAVLYAEGIRNAMASNNFNNFVSQVVLLIWKQILTYTRPRKSENS